MGLEGVLRPAVAHALHGTWSHPQGEVVPCRDRSCPDTPWLTVSRPWRRESWELVAVVAPRDSRPLGWAPVPVPSGHNVAHNLGKADKQACRILIGHAAELPGTHREPASREVFQAGDSRLPDPIPDG